LIGGTGGQSKAGGSEEQEKEMFVHGIISMGSGLDQISAFFRRVGF
jgi:hypothetical protein